MKHLLTLAFVALFTCKASAQYHIGITKQSLKESKGFIEVYEDSIRHVVKPHNALQFKGEYASYVGVVSKVIIIRPGYALLTFGTGKKQSEVFMFTKASGVKAMRYKGKLVALHGALEVYKGTPAFRDYGTNEGSIYPLRLANPGCNCIKGDPTNTVLIDTTKEHH
jgi:hypothetical protein